MTKPRTFTALWFVLVLATAMRAQSESEWDIRPDCWSELVRSVPAILRSQDPKTGRFGSGIWIVNDQNVLFPLAVSWAVPHPGNPYHKRSEVLDAVMAGGDALIDDQDELGRWEFRKKDGSTWGKTYMPWTYSRWVRAFALIREGMPADRRARWEKALALGYRGIAGSALGRVHNIPTHHAMGLYQAGKVLGRPDWCEQAEVFMAKVCQAQNPGGYWSEHHGPVVAYNFVYTEALGIYYAMSGDATVLPALEKSSRFHAAFTYPDGCPVETIDERNAYEDRVSLGTVGFCFSPDGRRFLYRQRERLRAAGQPIDADTAAAFILYGRGGPLAAESSVGTFVLGNKDAVTHYRRPWFACLSAFHCPVQESRWLQDRQNFVSLFHDRAGLILGGGNTKLQPRWSTFVVGRSELLSHRPGDTDPKFTPPAGIWHVPSRATLDPEQAALQLTYGPEECHVRVDLSDPHRAVLVYQATVSANLPVEAHVTLLPHMGEKWETASNKQGTLDASSWQLGPGECGGWFAHHGWRISVPAAATIRWPVLPHNPYRKDGRAAPAEGRIVLTLPFRADLLRHEVVVEVPPPTP